MCTGAGIELAPFVPRHGTRSVAPAPCSAAAGGSAQLLQQALDKHAHHGFAVLGREVHVAVGLYAFHDLLADGFGEFGGELVAFEGVGDI